MTALRDFIDAVPNFPKPGILFRDISRLLREQFPQVLAALDGLFTEEEWGMVDAIVGVESRGFILAAGLAAKRGKGFAPIRKKGKLPPPVIEVPYELEYGTGVLEMQPGSGRVLLLDDVLATGGTLKASAEVLRRAGYVTLATGVLIDLKLAPVVSLNGMTVRTVMAL